MLETERLLLREFVPDDAESMYLLNRDPEVIRYTGDTAFKDIEEARDLILNYGHYREYGFGRWAVISKPGNEFLGWCGLKYTPELDEHDIGFRFFRKHWNKGYATESAKACIEAGFSRFGINTIVGRAMKENTASIRVLEKLGMHFSNSFDFDGQEGVVYRKENIMEKAKHLRNKIHRLLNENRYEEANEELDKQFSNIESSLTADAFLLAEIAGSYITLGSESSNKQAVLKGLRLFEENRESFKGLITDGSINYCLGNGYHAVYRIDLGEDTSFPTPERVKGFLFKAKISYLRAFKELNIFELSDYSIQVLTNLGNNLNHMGRIVEALQYFDTVLQYSPDFPQALASKADGLRYMVQVTRSNPSISLVAEMYNLYNKINLSQVYDKKVKQNVKLWRENLFKILISRDVNISDLEREFQLNQEEFENHSTELKYYLNNFLALSEHSLYCKCNGAKFDDLSVGYSGMQTNNNKLFNIELLLNRIKSEFSLARSLYHNYLVSWSEDNVHYERFQREFLYGLHNEKLRTSFRLCFGIFDKIAEGICYLLDLHVGERESILFESFWRNQKASKDRWERINSFQNIHLTALYSIACDLNTKEGEFGFYKEWRNHIEHGLFSIMGSSQFKLPNDLHKRFSKYSEKENFEKKTLHLLQLTRAAIFSFVFCARQEILFVEEK